MNSILKKNYEPIDLSYKTYLNKDSMLDGKYLKEDVRSIFESDELIRKKEYKYDNSTAIKFNKIFDFIKLDNDSESNFEVISTLINTTIKRDFNNEEERKLYIKDKSEKLTLYLEEFDDNFNIISRAEEEVINISDKNGFNILGEILEQVLLDNFDKPKTLSSMCQCLRRFDLDEVSPWGPIMTIALLNNSDENVKADAIALIDNWEDKSLLPMLKGLDCKSKWFESYIKNVIKSLEV